MITIPSISAESIDDNIPSVDVYDDSIELGSKGISSIRELSMPDSNLISDSSLVSDSNLNSDSSILSNAYSDEDSVSNEVSKDSSEDLVTRIENANDGDTILIEPGRYRVHGINITKNISLQGNGDPRDIIIDGEELSTIFFIQNINISAKFNNLTITNGKTDNFGGGICVETGNTYVDNCIFINNTALNVTNGGAISNYGNDTDRSYLFVNNSLFIGNHADHDGGAITTCYARSDIFNSVFINNSARRDGGAIRVSIFGYGYVQDCIFMYNHADEWAGAYYSWAGNSSLDRCIFINNTAGTNGGAIMVSGSLNLTNSIIVNNTADETGGSFYIQQPMFDAKTVIKVENNIITNNTSPFGKEIFVKWNATNLLFPNFNNNDWGDEDPTDSSVVDPNNVSKRIKPSSTNQNMGLFDILDFSLLNRYSDILNDYYGREFKNHFKDLASDSNDSSLKFDVNKTGSEDSNDKNNNFGFSSDSDDSSNSRLNNESGNLLNGTKRNMLNNSSSSQLSNKSGTFGREKTDSLNSTFVNENSNNKKMVELFEDNPISQKSFDNRYILVLSIVLLIFLCGFFRKKDRAK